MPVDEGDRELLARTFDRVADDEGRSPLMRAVKKGHKATVKALLDVGADPNLTDPDGLTALMYAAQKPMVDNVAMLLDSGADLRPKDNQGRSALDHARAANRGKIVAVLEARIDG